MWMIFLYATAKKHEHNRTTTATRLKRIQVWALENGFQFSSTKTVCMHFCQLRKLHHKPELNIYGNPIPVVKEYKFLGVLFDSKLSFIHHMSAPMAQWLRGHASEPHVPSGAGIWSSICPSETSTT